MVTHRLILLLGLVTIGLGPAAAQATETVSSRVSVLSELHVQGEVDGDVVALGGDVVIPADAVVHGHAIAVLGSVAVAPGARVDGRVIAVSSLASLTLDPSADLQLPYLAAAVRLLTSGGWLLIVTLLAVAMPARMRFGVAAVTRLGPRVAVLGVLAAITLFAALVAALSLGPGPGVPLVVGVMLLFLSAKAVGLTVVGGFLGELLLSRRRSRIVPLSFEVFAGVAVLLALRFVPVVGGGLWTIASLFAVGAGVFALVLMPQAGRLGLPVPVENGEG